ncbi:hypothetical protein Tco_0332313 [Tanacetum coccineum]
MDRHPPGYLSGTSHPYHFLLGRGREALALYRPHHHHHYSTSSFITTDTITTITYTINHPQYRLLIYEIPEELFTHASEEVLLASPTPSHRGRGEFRHTGGQSRVTDLAPLLREETTSMYGIMEDAQDDRSQQKRPIQPCAECIDFKLTVKITSRQRVFRVVLASDHKRQVQLLRQLRLLKGLQQTQMAEFQEEHGP